MKERPIITGVLGIGLALLLIAGLNVAQAQVSRPGSTTPMHLNGVTGSGSSGQLLASDGAGGFAWQDAPPVKQLVQDFVMASGEEVSAGDVVSFLGGQGFDGSAEWGPESVFNAGSTLHIAVSALSASDFVVAYSDFSNSSYGTAITGTVGGGALSWGAESVFNAALTLDIAISALSDSDFVVAYRDEGNSNYGTAITGTVSGGTLSWGTESVFNAADTYFDIAVSSLSASDFVVAYGDTGNSSYGTAIVGTVGGGALSWGPASVFNAADTSHIAVSALSDTDFVVAYSDNGRSGFGTAIRGTVGGGALSWGTESLFNASTLYIAISALSDSDFVVAYRDESNSHYGTAIAGTVSGGGWSWGPPSVFNAATTSRIAISALSASDFVVAYEDGGNSYHGTAITGTVGGGGLSWGTESVFNAATTYDIAVSVLSDGDFVVAYQDYSNSGYGTAITGTVGVVERNQAPYVPGNPTPPDGAGDVPTNQTLSWEGGDPNGDPVTYTVALGNIDPPPVVATDVIATSYYPGAINADTTYYWTITATDGLSTSVGPTWRFTTSEELCPKPLADVTLLGPAQGFTNTAYAFTAFVTPADATPPITYTWEPTPMAAQGTTVATFTWDTPGTYAVNVSAANCGATVTDARVVQISALPPPATADAYEEDDACLQASTILTDGASQVHTFHDHGDVDWVAFTATLGFTYAIEVRVPPTSTADVELALYDTCGGDEDVHDPTFSPDMRLMFQAPTDGRYVLRLSNDAPAIYGAQASYHLSIREIRPSSVSGALVIVAGRLDEDNELQANIHNVTNAAYRLARDNGCAPEQIYYLATDPTLDADGDGQSDVDGPANRVELEQIIQQWGANTAKLGLPFTLYMMDHGGYDRFYLDGTVGEVITPTVLSGWLDVLDATGAEVNVIVEACQSGSFIDLAQTVSKEGRTVMASTGPFGLAYATQMGALFSDALLNALGQGMSLRIAFEEGRWAVGQAHPDQTPWLDGDGDGTANEPQDMQLATGRVFACAAAGLQAEQWPPHIEQVDVTGLGGSTGQIWAQVRDDTGVQRVWAVVYPPSYQPPESSEVFEAEPMPVELGPRGGLWYSTPYADFTESGEYRVIMYAQDEDGLDARPKEYKVQVWHVYLPVVLRTD